MTKGCPRTCSPFFFTCMDWLTFWLNEQIIYICFWTCIRKISKTFDNDQWCPTCPLQKAFLCCSLFDVGNLCHMMRSLGLEKPANRLHIFYFLLSEDQTDFNDLYFTMLCYRSRHRSHFFTQPNATAFTDTDIKQFSLNKIVFEQNIYTCSGLYWQSNQSEATR